MKTKYKSIKCEELVNLIVKCKRDNDVQGMFDYAVQLKNLAEDIQDTYSTAAAIFYMSLVSFTHGKFDETINLCMNSIHLCDLNNIPDYYSQTLNLMGIVYASRSDFMASISYLLKAYYFSLNHEELQYCHFPLNNIGALFNHLDIPDLALKYFLKSYDYKKSNKLKFSFDDAIPVINIIGANIKLARYDEAEKWFALYNQEYQAFENPSIRSEVDVQKIHLCKYYHKTDELILILDDLLGLKDSILDQTRYFKLLLEALEICIDLELKEPAIRLLDNLEIFPETMNNLSSLQRFSRLKVKMALKFYSKKTNYEQLFQYYLKNEDYRELEKNNTRQSLLTKIELEEMLNEHHQILLKNERLLKNNELDGFTGVYNKTAFKQHVLDAMREYANNEYAAMLMIDIDDFKKINDTFGHYVGDQVILDVVGLLKKEVQSSILIGRVGGDEFAVYFPIIYSFDYLYEKIDNYLRSAIRILVNDTAGLITLSIGVYLSNQLEPYDEMFKKADYALYMAKRKGKSQYATYSDQSKNELAKMKESLACNISFDIFLPSLYNIINTKPFSNDKLFTILEHCLQILELKHAYLLIFDQHYNADRLCILDKNKTDSRRIISGSSITIEQRYLDKFLTSPIYLIRNKSIEEHALSELKYVATMQSIIEFDKQKLGILAFNGKNVHLWTDQEISLLRTIAAALAPILYYNQSVPHS